MSIADMIARREAEIAQIKAELAKNNPPPAPVQSAAAPQIGTSIAMQMLMGLASKALSPEDLTYLQNHIKDGAPGIIPFMDSELLVQIFQLGFMEYKEFLAGRAK